MENLEFKGTKDQWLAQHDGYGLRVSTPFGRTICDFSFRDPSFPKMGETEANAKLIAASPDLLEALQELKESYIALAVRHGYHDNVHSWLEQLGVEQAIKKALI